MSKYEDDIRKGLNLLPEKNKVLFAFLICEKLFPHYIIFYDLVNWGSIEKLNKGILLIHNYLTGSECFLDSIPDLSNEIYLNTPDTDDFETSFVSFALNSCTAILSTLDFIQDKNTEHIVEVATFARDTVDLYVYLKNDIENIETTEIGIDADRFMVAEKDRQFELLKTLKYINPQEIDVGLIGSLRTENPIIDISILN